MLKAGWISPSPEQCEGLSPSGRVRAGWGPGPRCPFVFPTDSPPTRGSGSRLPGPLRELSLSSIPPPRDPRVPGAVLGSGDPEVNQTRLLTSGASSPVGAQQTVIQLGAPCRAAGCHSPRCLCDPTSGTSLPMASVKPKENQRDAWAGARSSSSTFSRLPTGAFCSPPGCAPAGPPRVTPGLRCLPATSPLSQARHKELLSAQGPDGVAACACLPRVPPTLSININQGPKHLLDGRPTCRPGRKAPGRAFLKARSFVCMVALKPKATSLACHRLSMCVFLV